MVFFKPKSAKMDHKKKVYTSGERVFHQKTQKWTTKKKYTLQEMGFSLKNTKMVHKKKVCTSGERLFLQKVQKLTT